MTATTNAPRPIPHLPSAGIAKGPNGIRQRIGASRTALPAPLLGTLVLAPFTRDELGQARRATNDFVGPCTLSGIGHRACLARVAWALALGTGTTDPPCVLTGDCSPELLHQDLLDSIANLLDGTPLTEPYSVTVQLPAQRHDLHPFLQLGFSQIDRGVIAALTWSPPIDLTPLRIRAEQALDSLGIPGPADHTVAYTDGSFAPGGRGGIAMVTTDGQWAAGLASKVAHDAFDCEADAARLAIEEAPKGSELLIRSDCRQLVQLLNQLTEGFSSTTRLSPAGTRLVGSFFRRETHVRASG